MRTRNQTIEKRTAIREVEVFFSRSLTIEA